MRHHLAAGQRGHLATFEGWTRILLRTRRGEIRQDEQPRARSRAQRPIDAQDQRSTVALTPTGPTRSLRRTRNPSERAGRLTCLSAYTRHRRILSLLLCIAGGLEQQSSHRQGSRQRSSLAASLQCPRNFLVQLLRLRQRPLFLKNSSSRKVSNQDSRRLRIQSASARSEQGRTQKQVRFKPTTRAQHQATAATGC